MRMYRYHQIMAEHFLFFGQLERKTLEFMQNFPRKVYEIPRKKRGKNPARKGKKKKSRNYVHT